MDGRNRPTTRRCDECREQTRQCQFCRSWSLQNINLLRTYGITVEERDRMHEEQGGLCWICGRAETLTMNGTLRGLCVDHDHATGKVRGLLCSGCNVAIGHLQHSEDLLLKALEYLRTK